ncbi:MAG: hypothetical protein HDT28_09540 [Clostridiales bacterium]|nr:hypothetical protein [Clostridiales bacterium]
MKKLIAVVFLFAAGLIATAIWFSPLTGLGRVYAYDNNEVIAAVDGVCYSQNGLYRVDFDGDETAMTDALDKIGARVVKQVEVGDTIIVYAFSDRVCAEVQYTAEGEEYNVMAAYGNGNVSVGTPILSGCY